MALLNFGTADLTGTADWLAGSTDEAVARQFDDTEGGGFADRSAWRESDRVVGGTTDAVLDNPVFSLQEQAQGNLTTIAELGAAAGGNPRDISDEELSRGFARMAGDAKQQFDRLNQNNPITNNVVSQFATEAFVAEPIKAGVEAGSGIDIDEPGSTEAELDTAQAFELAATAPALKGGKILGTSAVRFGDDALSALSKSDEAAAAASKSDEATTALSSSDETTSFVDDPLGALFSGSDEAASGADEGGSIVDDVANRQTHVVDDSDSMPFPPSEPSAASRLGDDADIFKPGRLGDDADTGPRRVTRTDDVAEDATGAADDVTTSQTRVLSTAEDTTQTGDEGGILDDVLSRSEDTADAGEDVGPRIPDEGTAADDSGSVWDDLLNRGEDAEDAADAGEDSGSLLDNLFRGSDDAADESGGLVDTLFGTKKRAAATSGGLLVGGASLQSALSDAEDPQDAPDQMETADGKDLVHAKDYTPTEKFPQGGRLYAVTDQFANQGYWLYLGRVGRNIIVLDESGEPRKAKLSTETFKEMVQDSQTGGARGGGR